MLVFTLPSYDVVFKLIKDHFDFPKDTSRSEVMRCYGIVFEHDRAGRLVEAHEFEHLRIARDRFDPALLEDRGAMRLTQCVSKAMTSSSIMPMSSAESVRLTYFWRKRTRTP